MIHICFALYDKSGHYSKFIGTTMLSIFENTNSKVTIHILHDNTLTYDNREKFVQLTKHYNQIIKFYNVEELCTDRIKKIRECFPEADKSVFSIATFYRLLIPNTLPSEVKKVIYLDADIIVNLDINELWQIELEDSPLAAGRNIFSLGIDPLKISGLLNDGLTKVEDYFNAGVLLMNLKTLRNEEDAILTGIKFIGENPKYNLGDQDILNYLFSTRYLKLPIKFNRLVKMVRNYGDFTTKDSICHYVAGQYSLGFDMNDSFHRLWWSYFIKTPWFGVDTLDNILKGAADSMLKMSELPSNKARVFIVDEEHADQIERNFSVRDEEKVVIVDTENEDELQSLTEFMKSGKGRKIFFVGIPSIAPKLTEMGFWEGKDFFNVSAFHSPLWVNITSNYKLILSL